MTTHQIQPGRFTPMPLGAFPDDPQLALSLRRQLRPKVLEHSLRESVHGPASPLETCQLFCLLCRINGACFRTVFKKRLRANVRPTTFPMKRALLG